jgi:hypothetical protein
MFLNNENCEPQLQENAEYGQQARMEEPLTHVAETATRLRTTRGNMSTGSTVLSWGEAGEIYCCSGIDVESEMMSPKYPNCGQEYNPYCVV